MINKENLTKVFNLLSNDETLCRLLIYKDNPLSETYDDIVGSDEHLNLINNIIKFYPQFIDIDDTEKCRMALYKGSTRSIDDVPALKRDLIQIDVYIPTRFTDMDMRIYDVEERILALLDNKRIDEFSKLKCTSCIFVSMPSITGYTVYKISFDKVESRGVR